MVVLRLISSAKGTFSGLTGQVDLFEEHMLEEKETKECSGPHGSTHGQYSSLNAALRDLKTNVCF